MEIGFELLMLSQDGKPEVTAAALDDASAPFVIGSASDADMVIRAPGVAARHCKLLISAAGAIELVNLDEAGPGTLCNGRQVNSALLQDGDWVQAGEAVMVLRLASAESSRHSPTRGARSEPSPPPSRASSTAPQAVGPVQHEDSQIAGVIAELTAAYPDRVASHRAGELASLLERGRDQAIARGFDAPDQIAQFLQCVFLLDNDLSRPTNSDVAYVIDTLSVPNKPAGKRLERALGLARRVAENRPVGTTPEAPATPAPRRAAPLPKAEPPPIAAPLKAEKTPRLPFGMTTVNESLDSPQSAPSPVAPAFADDARSEFPVIEGFRIIDRIASGGMGTVYRAHDLQLDIEVAIKVLRSMHPSAQKQFLLEARAAAKLQHPHIVPVLRYEQYGQGGYCVMQLIKGKDAHRLIRLFSEGVAHELDSHAVLELAGLDPAAMTPDLRGLVRVKQPYYRFVASWMAGIAEGLDRAHAEGIVHYDVKPSNMMLAADGRLMLGDFGLATLAGHQLTSNSSCIGTPGYLSPEMLAGWASRSGSSETDARVDIWGLGVTMYEFLAFKPAYSGSLGKVLRAIATVEPARPRDVVWQTPPELERVCLKAMARNPDERYRRASEMADDLRSFLAARSSGPGTKAASGPLAWLKRPQSGG